MDTISKPQEKLWHRVMFDSPDGWRGDEDWSDAAECIFLYGDKNPLYIMILDGQLSGGHMSGNVTDQNFVEQFSHEFQDNAAVWDYLDEVPAGNFLKRNIVPKNDK